MRTRTTTTKRSKTSCFPNTYTARVRKYTNPAQAQRQARKYLGKHARICPATNKNKKYRIWDKKNLKWVHFGAVGYEDYTKHKNKTRRKNYLMRSKHIKGKWRNNPYSANNLSRHILW